MQKIVKWTSVDWNFASDIDKRIKNIIKSTDLSWIDKERIFCLRSTNSTSRAYARIWGLSKVWQIVLKTKPTYVIEVLSQRFDKLSDLEKDKVLLHELAHIPKNFSGSLLPHIRKKGKRNFHSRLEKLISNYFRNN